MPWTPEERRQLGTELDEVQRRLKIVYRYCLYALILLVTGFPVVLFRSFAHDANRGFLNLYGGVAYLTFLPWGIRQLRALPPPPSGPPHVRASFGRGKGNGGRGLSLLPRAPQGGARARARGPAPPPPPPH